MGGKPPKLNLPIVWKAGKGGKVVWVSDDILAVGGKLYDRQGRELWELPLGIVEAASPDGKYLAAETLGILYIYDVLGKRLLGELEVGEIIFTADFSWDGRLVALGLRGRLAVARLEGGQPRLTGEIKPAESEWPVWSVRFHPREYLVVARDSKGYITLIEVDRARYVSWTLWRARPRDHTDSIHSVGFSDDGNHIVAGGDDGLYVLDSSTGEVVWKDGEASDIRSVLWAGDTILAANRDGVVHIYKWKGESAVKTYEVVTPLSDIYYDRGLALNRPRKLLATSNADQAVVLDMGLLEEPPIVKRPLAPTIAQPLPYVTDTIMNILARRLRGFRPGPAGSRRFEFMVRREHGLKGLEGVWECERLGCGGWGCAYKCVRGGSVVVFKVPRGYEGVIEESTRVTVDERFMRRITREAGLVSGLKHPHILRLLSYSTTAPLLVYEYADGGSLEWQRSQGWRPGLAEALLLAAQVGDALRYIHSRGLIHGDIKASNVFVVGGIVKLGDFNSLTSLLARTSTASTMMFTPGWRAPEQVYLDLRRRTVELGFENRIDVYQIGNLLLYMVTGETIDGEEVVDPRAVEDKLGLVGHEGVRRLLKAMLSPEPWKRPSAEEAAKALAALYHELSEL